MASFRDAMDALVARERDSSLCKVGRFQQTLSPEDEAAFQKILNMNVGVRDIADALRPFIKVGTTTLAEHRSGRCACRA